MQPASSLSTEGLVGTNLFLALVVQAGLELLVPDANHIGSVIASMCLNMLESQRHAPVKELLSGLLLLATL